MRAIHWVHVPILRIKKTSADFGYYETNAITVKTTEAKLIKMRIKTFGNWLYLKNPKYYVGEFSTVDVTLSKSAPTTTTSTGNAAVIIVNICKYAIWDWHDQSLVLSKIRNDIAKWTILFSQMVYITLQYRLYHFVISSILQCCQYTLTTLLIYFCNQLRLLSKQNCVRCWLFQNLLLLHFNQSFHLFRTIPAII